MGLDTVELVMEVEEEFSIDIPNELASTLTTVGKLHCFVVAELHRRDRPRPSKEVFEQLRELIVTQIGVRPEQVVANASFVDDLGMD
jgi:acyl carrier protein